MAFTRIPSGSSKNGRIHKFAGGHECHFALPPSEFAWWVKLPLARAGFHSYVAWPCWCGRPSLDGAYSMRLLWRAPIRWCRIPLLSQRGNPPHSAVGVADWAEMAHSNWRSCFGVHANVAGAQPAGCVECSRAPLTSLWRQQWAPQVQYSSNLQGFIFRAIGLWCRSVLHESFSPFRPLCVGAD